MGQFTPTEQQPTKGLSPNLKYPLVLDTMNVAHLHLILNHVPVLGTAFGLGLLTFALWRKSEEVKKAALGLFVISALLAIPVYLTGEPAEEIVEELPDVSHANIEEHEEAAEVAFIGVLALGVAALAGLVWRRGRTVPTGFASGILAASVAVCGLMAWTANLGGQVRHTEIRSGTSAPVDGADKDNH